MWASCFLRTIRVPSARLAILFVVPLSACQGTSRPAQEPRPSCMGQGSICTWAGSGDPAFVDGELTALETPLYWPLDVEFAPAPDARGYILDWQNHRVRRVDADGVVRTIIGTDEIGDGPLAGTGSETTAPGIAGTLVNLNHPTDIQFGPDGTLLLASWHNHKIRTFDAATGLLRIACGRGPGFAGDGGPADAALLSMPKAIAVAPSGDVYVVDTRNFRVRRIAAGTGIMDTVAGVGTRGAGGDGGDPLAAQFSFQRGLDPNGGEGGDNPEPGGAVAVDGQGRLYIADTENQRIRRVDLVARTIETIAGDGTAGFSGDGGPATSARLNYPRDIEIAADGRLFIADTDNHRIRVVDPNTGIIDTIAGIDAAGNSGDGGPARQAALRRPWGIGFDAVGDLFIADTLNNRVRRVVQP